MNSLIALDLAGGQRFVDELSRAWDNGDAVLPIDQRLATHAKRALMTQMRASQVIDETGSTTLEGGQETQSDDALVVATSGTTGQAKGVVLTHAAVLASALASSRALGVDVNDHWLACLPLCHVGGLSVVTRALLTGNALTVMPGFDAQEVTRAAHECNLVSLVPTALQRIDPRLFRAILLGGSRPPNPRPANTIATYGLTETGSGVVYDGVPLVGVEISFTTDDEILLRSPMNMRSYRNGETCIDSAGWLHTGDIGRLLPNGHLSVEGRRDDMITSGGEKVWPEAVEDSLRTLLIEQDFAIVGMDDDEWGQKVVLVSTAIDLDIVEVRAHVNQTLPMYCAPKDIYHLPSIPRTALGKVQRHIIAEALLH